MLSNLKRIPLVHISDALAAPFHAPWVRESRMGGFENSRNSTLVITEPGRRLRGGKRAGGDELRVQVELEVIGDRVNV